MKQLTQLLTKPASRFAAKRHWKKQVNNEELAAEDRTALQRMLAAAFDSVPYQARKANQ